MVNQEFNQDLINAIAEYWHGYATATEEESPSLRRWSDETLARGMVERAVLLMDTCVSIGDIKKIKRTELVYQDNIISVPEYREWNGIQISILGVNVGNDKFPNSFSNRIRDISKESLPLCIFPSSYFDEWQKITLEIRKNGGFIIPVFPCDLNAVASGRWSILNLIEFKICRMLLLNKLDIETQFGEMLFGEFEGLFSRQKDVLPFLEIDAALARLDDSPSNWAEHPKLNQVMITLQNHRDCLLIGKSSSGKTTLAIVAGLKFSAKGTKTYLADLGVVSSNMGMRLFRELLKVYSGEEDILIIIDDLQSNPSVAKFFFTIRRILRNAGIKNNLRVLAISWPSFLEQASEALPEALRMNVSPKDVQHALLAKYGNTKSAADVAAIDDIAEDDVLLWRLLLESNNPERPTKTSLAKNIWQRKLKGYDGEVVAAKRVALIAATLGQYEFDLSEGYLRYQASVDHNIVESLIRAKILRRSLDRLLLGHRSLCLLLGNWLSKDEETQESLKRAGKPADSVEIVNSYIRLADASDTWGILKSLHAQVGFKGGPSLSYKAQILADAWESIDSLLERIEHQQEVDPTWRNNLASVVFAVEALCSVGKHKRAEPSVEFMRAYWQIRDGNIEISPGTNDRGDFDQIQIKMKKEDEIVDPASHNYEAADEINVQRFYLCWIQGMIMCAEYAYGERSEKELERLAICVEKLQELDGFFYPSRVPWVTARVLMGLSRCGRTVENSEVVRKACEWLLRPKRAGGVYQDGVWESGTGAWNTTLETTAMCLIALIEAGLPKTDTRLIDAWNYVASMKSEWTRQKHEIDGANALIAYLKVIGNWQDVIPQVQYLLRWARGQAFWDSATLTADKLLDQTCKVAVIADYLIEASWASLRNDLPEFLQAFAVSDQNLESNESLGSHTTLPDRQSLVDQKRSHVNSLIIIDSQQIIFQRKKNMDELNTYEDRLAAQGKTDTKELQDRRLNIKKQIREIEAARDAYIYRLQAAKSEKEIDEIYEQWQRENQNS